jgi:hypothetical protein
MGKVQSGARSGAPSRTHPPIGPARQLGLRNVPPYPIILPRKRNHSFQPEKTFMPGMKYPLTKRIYWRLRRYSAQGVLDLLEESPWWPRERPTPPVNVQ